MNAVNFLNPMAKASMWRDLPFCVYIETSLQGDVRKAEDVLKWVKEATERFGRLSILVNCAAGNFLVSLSLLSPSRNADSIKSHT